MRDNALDNLRRELNDTGLSKGVPRKAGRLSSSLPSLSQTDPDIITPNSLLSDGDGVLNWIRERQGRFSIPAPPGTSAENISLAANSFSQSCARSNKDCDKALAYGNLVTALRDASSKHPSCNEAAELYAKDYEFTNPPNSVAVKYDASCLGSLSTRYRGFTQVVDEPLPPVFTGGADGNGALSAVAILEDDSGPFCGGLLRNDRTVVTAQHCVTFKHTSFQENRVKVRSVTGSQAWSILPPPVAQAASSLVRDDWTILKLGGIEPVTVASTTLAKDFNLPEALTFVASFSPFGLMDYRDNSPSWRHSLRYPRAGMCHGLVVVNGCLVMTCQTVPGFSGAPIFRVSSGGNAPTVVGFVSGTLDRTTGCPVAGPFPTLAVFADRIR